MEKMNSIKRLAVAGLLMGSWVSADSQAAITFDPTGDSIVTIRFTPNMGAPGTFTEKTYKTTGGDMVFNGSVPTLPEFAQTNTSGTSTSAGKASVDHNTSASSAAISWGAGSGVGQTDPTGTGSYGGNPSQTRITVDMKWSLDGEWASGSRTVYQLLPIKLSAAAAGDSASVTGSFNYTLDLDTNGSIDKSAAISYTQSLVGPSAGLSTTIYKSALLSATGIPAPGVGLHHLFRITGTLTFSALDPFDAGLEQEDINDPLVRQHVMTDLETMFPGITDPMNPNGLDFNDILAGGGATHKEIPLTPQDPVSVPEPASFSLLALAALAMIRRRK